MKIPSWLKDFYFKQFFSVKEGKCLFVPHPGFCKNDCASIINYKADNCLIFVRYLLDNNLYGESRELVVVSTTVENAKKEQAFCNQMYPDARIKIIPDVSRVKKTEWASSEYIFGSEFCFSQKKKRKQKYFCLGYYPIGFKNDYHEISDPWFGGIIKRSREIDWISSSSLINSQIDSSSFAVPFGKYLPIGKCRTDVLLQPEDVSYVRDYIMKNYNISYKVKKFILYAPTHRDYERASFDIKRSILGFDVNKNKFEKFLTENELLIVCKLHPAQNALIVNDNLPNGVINFKGCDVFGLTELMKTCDMLITDYTSAYADFLLLDKPVIFNLYDLDIYEKTRGLAFMPYKFICAGKTFVDEESFYIAIKNTLENPDEYKERRKELSEFFISYRTDVCKKTYNAIFNR